MKLAEDITKELIQLRNKLFDLSKQAEQVKLKTKFGEFPDLELLYQIDSSRLSIGNALIRLNKIK